MKPIFANIFTTLHADLAKQAASFLLPWNRSQWKNGTDNHMFIETFRKVVNIDESYCVVPMYNARSALYHGLKTLDIGPWDEVLLQAYTCISVPNAIIATWATPVYVDIDMQTANIDPTLLEVSITKNTKAILIQHTFGIVADIHRVQKVCKRHDLLLIEDCAHALWATYTWQSVWTFGDMALFSLGRDKVLTTTNGGILLMPKQYKKACKAIEASLHMPSTWVILQNVLYMVLGWIAYRTYAVKVGKILYYIAAKTKLLPLIITPAEKSCSFTNFSLWYPNVLAKLATTQLRRLPEITQHRRSGAQMYVEALWDSIVVPMQDGDVYLRVIYTTNSQQDFIREAKKHSIHLWDPWYDKVIAWRWVDVADAWYTMGSCPYAQELAWTTINLPNHMLMDRQDYTRVIQTIQHIRNIL